MAAVPATFCAMSWMTVKVVTTRNGFFVCAWLGATKQNPAIASVATPATDVLTDLRAKAHQFTCMTSFSPWKQL